MKEQIQQLIANNQTEDALRLLQQSQGDDALLLMAQYNQGKKQFNLGLIEFSEWQRIQARVNYAALELAARAKPIAVPAPSGDNTGFAPSPTGTPHTPAATSARKTAFISYNHGDQDVALRVRDFLQQNDIDVTIDIDDMEPGMSIMEFIQNSIRTADAVVSIVSAKSLASGWVGQESVASMYAVWLANKRFLPVKLDSVAFDIDFQITAQETLQQKIQDLDTKIEKLRQLGGDPRAFNDDRDRLFELKNNLGQIIQRLKSVLMLDISGANFDANMQRIVQQMRK